MADSGAAPSFGRRDLAMAPHDRVQGALTALLLASALLLGGAQGGQGMLGDIICQALSLLLLAWLLWRSNAGCWSVRPPTYTLLVVLVPLLLAAGQCLPLPSGLWASNETRASLAADLALANVGLRAHVSLVPYFAERALWSLLPATVLAISVVALPPRAQRQIVGLFLVLAVTGLLWAIVQRAHGPDSALRLYRFTNLTDATGFFANRSHLASQLLMALPLGIAWAAWCTTRRLAGHPVHPVWWLSSLALAVFLILGIALTRSRAGVLLGFLGVLLCLPMVLGLRQQRGRRRVLAGIVVVGAVLSVNFALFGILQRLHKNPLEDVRWGFAEVTAQAAQAHAPLGSGLGSFRDVYPSFELVSPSSRIVNHTHNDWLELWLEGGWPFLILAGLFVSFFVWAGTRIWRAGADEALLLCTRAAWIGLLLVLLHALVDYALRTTANMVGFALLMALLLSGLANLQAPTRSRHRRPLPEPSPP